MSSNSKLADKLYVSLRDHFDSRIVAIEKYTATAAGVLEKRLESMNEFREALKNQATQFVTRAELNAIRERFDLDIRILREYKAAMDGKASQLSVIISALIAVVSLAISILGIIK